MTHEKFLIMVQGYFGEYQNKTIYKTIFNYIFEKVKESDLEYIHKILLETYSTRYKTQPDIADIKKIITDYNMSLPVHLQIGLGNENKLKEIERIKQNEISN